MFGGDLPSHTRVSIRCIAQTLKNSSTRTSITIIRPVISSKRRIITVMISPKISRGTAITYCVEIRETYLYTIGLIHFIVAYFTPRIAHFKHIHPLQVLLDKRFFGDVPGSRIGGKETKLMTRSKVFWTSIAKVKVQEITIVPVVGNTTGQPLMTERKRIDDFFTDFLCSHFGVLRVFQCSVQHMSFEIAGILKFRFKIFFALSTIAWSLIHHLLFLLAGEVDGTVILSITVSTP